MSLTRPRRSAQQGRPFRTLRRLWSALLWAFWALLVVVWLATLWDRWQAGDRVAAALALAAVALLGVLYYAEGIELAVTDLLDKEPDQMRNVALRTVLEEIQQRSAFFYAQRQVFVVVIIAFTSLVTAYSSIVIPFVGRVSSHGFPFWFSFLFTTLTVLWFCQVTPKRLAVLNSELFLAQSRFVWRLIKLIGVLGLPNPSDWLVSAMEQHSGYGQRRHLLPSRAAHYALTSQLEGVSLDRVMTSICLGGQGSGTVVKRYLTLFLHGAHGQLRGELDSASTFADLPRVTLLGLYTLPASERFESLAPGLDALFLGGEAAEEHRFSRNLINDWTCKVEIELETPPEGHGLRATWTIEGERLPESFWPEGAEQEPAQTCFAALLYEVEAELGEHGFAGGRTEDEDRSWSEAIALPCRIFSIAVSTRPEAGLAVVAQRFGVTVRGSTTELAEESGRYTRSALARRGAVDVRYPLQGGTYSLYWRVFAKAPAWRGDAAQGLQ